MTDPTFEQIRILSKLLKVPTFMTYNDILRQAAPNTGFEQLLLTLMQKEYEQRQENNNRRRLKQACFPYTKTLDELDISRYDGKISTVFMNELASCRFMVTSPILPVLSRPYSSITV